MELYFKSDYHKETALNLMQRLGFQRLEDDREYGSFCYVATATNKYVDLEKIADSEGIDLDILEQKMLVYSASEMALIRFALQLFSSELDDITLPEVMSSLDEENKSVVLAAIRFRFRIKEPYRQID